MESGQHAQPDWCVAMQPHSYTKVRSNVHFDTFWPEVTWTFPTVLAPVARLLDQTKRSSSSNSWLSVHYCSLHQTLLQGTLTLTSGDFLHPTRVALGKCSDPVIQPWLHCSIFPDLSKKKLINWGKCLLPTNRYYNEEISSPISGHNVMHDQWITKASHCGEKNM